MRESCKPAPSTNAPWASFDGYAKDNYSSTYASAYIQMGVPKQAQAIRPKAQHPWTSDAKFDTRSTAQDAFLDMKGKPRESCKPIREYEPIQWSAALTTTAGASYIPYYKPVRREPFRPARREVDGSKFDTRSTSQDSYNPFPSGYRPVRPIYPKEPPREDTKFENTTTSRSSYVAHSVQPYVPAAKPKPTMGALGGE